MNYSGNLGRRCNTLRRSRSPYPPKAWLELPSPMYPIVNDPNRCRLIEEETRRLCREKIQKVNEFHKSVCARLRRMKRDCDLAEPPHSARIESSLKPIPRPKSAMSLRSVSPDVALTERLSIIDPGTPSRFCKKAMVSQEERNIERMTTVRSRSASRDRVRARLWREENERKQRLAEIQLRQKEIARLEEQARLEQERVEELRKQENVMLEQDNRMYATEMKRLIAARLLRKVTTPVSECLSTPYDSEYPFGRIQLPFEARRLLKQLPPLCSCVDDWWETNPDKCSCSLRNNWTECVQGLEKLLSITVHGAHCF